jgi:hypothetical protein
MIFGGNMFFERRIDVNHRSRDYNRIQRPVRPRKEGCEFFYSWTGKRNGVQVFGNDLLEYKLNNMTDLITLQDAVESRESLDKGTCVVLAFNGYIFRYAPHN